MDNFSYLRLGVGCTAHISALGKGHPAQGTHQRQFAPGAHFFHSFCLQHPQCCAIIFGYLVPRTTHTQTQTPEALRIEKACLKLTICKRGCSQHSPMRKSTCLCSSAIQTRRCPGPVQWLHRSGHASPQTSSSMVDL